ncbi:lactate utilization protein [Candidatus Kaiserbacteria bacterium]|nr:lactate utilization protein [Candidatus Kaiserbacteria bacterium]
MDFETLASGESIAKVVAALKERNVEGISVKDRVEAMEKIKEFIPKGASVNTGASTTLEQIGFVEYLKSGTHGWNNLKGAIATEKDAEKQAVLRREALLSEFYLGSVHGLAETGEFVVGSNTGSQLPHIAYSSQNLILVVSTKKIVPTLLDAIRRLEEHVVPLEDARMKKASDGKYGTRLSKEIIFRYESPFNKRKIRMLLVSENLGF